MYGNDNTDDDYKDTKNNRAPDKRKIQIHVNICFLIVHEDTGCG